MAAYLANIIDIESTAPPENGNSADCGKLKSDCGTQRKKKTKPKLKITSIAFFSEEGKPLEGIDKECSVVLKMKYVRPEGLDLIIEIPQSEFFYFELNKEKVSNEKLICLTDGETDVKLDLKFY